MDERDDVRGPNCERCGQEIERPVDMAASWDVMWQTIHERCRQGVCQACGHHAVKHQQGRCIVDDGTCGCQQLTVNTLRLVDPPRPGGRRDWLTPAWMRDAPGQGGQ